jgi:hypothetical protein
MSARAGEQVPILHSAPGPAEGAWHVANMDAVPRRERNETGNAIRSFSARWIMKKPESHYKKEGDQYLVEIKLNEIRQLFNSFDPAPFLEKDLDSDAEKYIVDSVQELHLDTPITLVLHLPHSACTDEAASSVPAAIHNYFSYRAEITSKELRFTLQQGRIALGTGLLFLVLCIVAQQMISSMEKPGLMWAIVEEGFLISGWVAMWRPIQVFLYDWWPILRRRRIYEKLARLPVALRPYD